jgi:hypothetical protein
MVKNARPKRSKRRFPCEFVANEQRYRGIVLDVSRVGLFVQTDATVPPGTTLSLDLIGTGSVPDQKIRGVVARRRMVPAPLANAIRRGIGVRILAAPREWGLTFQSELLDAPIRVNWGSQSDPADAPEEDSLEDEAASDALRADAARRLRLKLRRQETRVEHEPAPQEIDSRPEALVIDPGDLGDVRAILDDLGVDVLVTRPGRSGALGSWLGPRRLLVTSARLALTLPWPSASEGDGVVAIAVADDDSHTLNTQMRRLGFQYLVSRPVHAEALRLLLRQALYRGGEHRRATRRTLGCEVGWRSGLWRRPGTLAEMSSEGCRLLSLVAVELGASVRITIPAEAAGGSRLTLRGQVVRRERASSGSDAHRVALGVAFDALSSRVRLHLDDLLRRRAMGPAMLQRDALAPAADEAACESASSTPREVAAPEPDSDTAAVPEERREQPRGLLDREVVALHEDRQRVVHTLVGRDLSRAGMRIDPHPDVALGARLWVVLYEQAHAHTLVLDAEVTRDDGERGLLLSFPQADATSLDRIGQIVAQLPPVQALQPQPHRVALGTLLLSPRAA